jgi:hypothetical protein
MSLSVILSEDPTGFLVYQQISMRVGGFVTAEPFGGAICFRISFPMFVFGEELFDEYPDFEFCRAPSRGRYGSDEAQV